jgi:predicted P-loop ATPase/GTPase
MELIKMEDLIEKTTELLEENYNHPMDPELLKRIVKGVVKDRKIIEPGLRDKNVEVTLEDGRKIVGQCLGYLAINRDQEISYPFLTIRCQESETRETLHHLPPKKVVDIKEQL